MVASGALQLLSEMVNPFQPGLPQMASVLVCQLVFGVGAQTEGNVDRKSPRALQKKQRPLSVGSQEHMK